MVEKRSPGSVEEIFCKMWKEEPGKLKSDLSLISLPFRLDVLFRPAALHSGLLIKCSPGWALTTVWKTTPPPSRSRWASISKTHTHMPVCSSSGKSSLLRLLLSSVLFRFRFSSFSAFDCIPLFFAKTPKLDSVWLSRFELALSRIFYDTGWNRKRGPCLE